MAGIPIERGCLIGYYETDGANSTQPFRREKKPRPCALNADFLFAERIVPPQRMLRPPSTGRAWPVMKLELGPPRKAITSAISPASASRPRGCLAATISGL